MRNETLTTAKLKIYVAKILLNGTEYETTIKAPSREDAFQLAEQCYDVIDIW